MKCEKCGEEFESDEIDSHNPTCSYAFSNKDYEDLIPCEICNELISFDDYARHLSRCSRPRLNTIQMPPLPIFNLNNFPNLGVGNLNQENNDNQEPGEDNLQADIDVINNDPIARSLFSMLVGNLPPVVPVVEPAENNDVNQDEFNNNEDNESDRMDIDSETDSEEQPNSNINEFNFIPNNINPIQNQDDNSNQPQEDNNLQNNELPMPPFNQNIPGLLENILNEMPLNQNQNLNLNINNMAPNLNEDNYEELINLEDHVVGISDINEISELTFEEIECPICSETKMVKRTTNCNHSFCDKCLQEWLNSSKKCPICMVELE